MSNTKAYVPYQQLWKVPEFTDKPSARFAKGEDKMPFENEQYDMLETWNTICDLVNKGRRSQIRRRFGKIAWANRLTFVNEMLVKKIIE